MQFIVFGLPGPQGSKRFVGRAKSGRGILVESSAKVKPWREAVKSAVFDEWRGRGPGAHLGTKGPVCVDLIFTWPKPKTAPKKRRTFPDRRPDIDKLCRSTLDGLKDAGAIEDDARVIELIAAKRYPGEGLDALDVPGCVIRIEAVGL